MSEQELIGIALEFAAKRNEIETMIFEKAELDSSVDYFPEYEKEYDALISSYCTIKKRVYSGSGSYGSPPNFVGIEQATDINFELKNQRRAEIIFTTDTVYFGETKYMFVLMKKKDGWKIDNTKKWDKYESKWRSHTL